MCVINLMKCDPGDCKGASERYSSWFINDLLCADDYATIGIIPSICYSCIRHYLALSGTTLGFVQSSQICEIAFHSRFLNSCESADLCISFNEIAFSKFTISHLLHS